MITDRRIANKLARSMMIGMKWTEEERKVFKKIGKAGGKATAKSGARFSEARKIAARKNGEGGGRPPKNMKRYKRMLQIMKQRGCSRQRAHFLALKEEREAS